ncbi:MAG: endonuclease V, partial [bacterium]
VDIIAGVDTASIPRFFNRFRQSSEQVMVAVVVLWSVSKKEIISHSFATCPAPFPYVPGLLGFRELPAIISAFENLSYSPEALIVDGHGIAHPRRFGIASHLGLILNLPTIGCAKSRLCGQGAEPGLYRSDWVPLYPDEKVETSEGNSSHPIGAIVRTRQGVKPVYVSPGHRCNLSSAIRLVLYSAVRFRIPEPIRWAHRLANEHLKHYDLS